MIALGITGPVHVVQSNPDGSIRCAMRFGSCCVFADIPAPLFKKLKRKTPAALGRAVHEVLFAIALVLLEKQRDVTDGTLVFGWALVEPL